MKELKAKDCMNKAVFTIKETIPVEEAIELLLKEEISNAPVVADGKLTGFLTEADCLRFLSNELYYSGPETSVGSIMKRHPVCVTPDTNMFAVTSLFTDNGFRHLPVVDNDKLVGIISRRDALKAMKDYHNNFKKENADKHFPPDLKKLVNHRFVIK